MYMCSTGIINGALINSGSAQLRGQLNGFVNNNAGTITLTGALTGLTTFSQAAGATLNLGGFSLSISTLSGAGSILFGTARQQQASAGSSAPAAELVAAAGAAPSWLVPQDSAAPGAASVAAGVAPPSEQAAADLASAPAGEAAASTAPLSGNGTAGRASGFGLVAVENAQAAPGAGLVAIDSPMTRPGAGALGGNGDAVAVVAGTETQPNAATPAATAQLAANVSGGGDIVQLASGGAPIAAVTNAVTLTPLAPRPRPGQSSPSAAAISIRSSPESSPAMVAWPRSAPAP